MDNKSLMLGDWVQHRDGTPYQIAEIGGMVCIDAEQELFASLEDIQPIPLTAEIMEKNGWRNSAPDVWEKEYGGFAFYWENRTGRFGMYDFRYLQEQWTMHLQIKYTHQLQHALRLCGIEKEIVLKRR